MYLEKLLIYYQATCTCVIHSEEVLCVRIYTIFMLCTITCTYIHMYNWIRSVASSLMFVEEVVQCKVRSVSDHRM